MAVNSVPVETGGKDAPAISRRELLEEYGCAGGAGEPVWTSRERRHDFYRYEAEEEVHTTRRKRMLRKYPQIRELYKPDPIIAVQTLSVVAMQMVICWMMRDKAWWFVVLCGYFVGAFANQNLFLAIHELTHCTAFGMRRKWPNMLVGYLANTPAVVPMFTSFRKYHMDHHTALAVDGEDVDVPTAFEGLLINNTFTKLTWASLQILSYALRPVLVKPKPPALDDALNWLYILAVDALVLRFWGLQSFLFLAYSSLLGGGLHPMAGHFIAEHYVFVDGQETYSYYGALNWITYNVGYHVEHHDFPRIPGTRLPALHRIAPEFYQHLYHHTSWVWVIWTYITCPAMGPFARYKRKNYFETKAARIKSKLLQSCDDDGRATSKNSDAARSHGSSATE